MADILTHRGPDDCGVWTDPTHPFTLGHQRLAILDVSPEGHQPMLSASARYVIAYNGEVYNHLDLRRELGAVAWRGHSDTETILAAVERWGVEVAVERFVGMFAIALWDREREELWLIRDRLGIKPLYYGWAAEGLLFGSELSALRAHSSFKPAIDRKALELLLRYNSIPSPHTIYQDTYKVRPGTMLQIRAARPDAVEEIVYWSAGDVALTGQEESFSGRVEEAVEQLEVLLREAVGMRMLSDVPLGAFLSGGVDSSTVVALMQAQSDRPVKTFSIGSPDAGFDEAAHAREVARHLGTDHTELYVTPEDALAVVPRLATMYDEPFADSSQIPTFLVSQLARREVTVALSGDGGDELFAGYNRHVWAGRVWNAVRVMPQPMRRLVARALTGVAPDTYDRGFARVDGLLPGLLQHRMPGYKIHKLAGSILATTPMELYDRLASQWLDPSAVLIGGGQGGLNGHVASGLDDFASQMMLLDMQRYLPDDILTKVDRASMAVSLEARVPILDHRVVEFAWRLPLNLKIRDGQSKWVLRQVLYRHVPRQLIERPKMGFGIPLGRWLRGPLREWAEDLLGEKRLREEGFFRPGPIRKTWRQHLAGTHAWEHQLWTVLMFQQWLDVQRNTFEHSLPPSRDA
jgi:asparagine synthase (glutamine-hydrolysing)